MKQKPAVDSNKAKQKRGKLKARVEAKINE